MVNELFNEIVNQYFKGKSIESILEDLKSELSEEDLEDLKQTILKSEGN